MNSSSPLPPLPPVKLSCMKYRKLRMAWSVTWGVVAVLLCVLWVRSYRNSSSWPTPLARRGDLAFYSTPGLMLVARAPFATYQEPAGRFDSFSIPTTFQAIGGGFWIGARRDGIWGFTAEYWSQSNWLTQGPYWFTTVSIAALAA